jgi:hypothetical protein
MEVIKVDRLGFIGNIRRNVHNDAMTKIITCWKNDEIVQDLDSYCESERLKSSQLQPT